MNHISSPSLSQVLIPDDYRHVVSPTVLTRMYMVAHRSRFFYGSSLVFSKSASLPGPLSSAGANILSLSSNFVIFESTHANPYFDWDGFKNAVATRVGPRLSLVKTESTSIALHTASVEDMAGRISQFFSDKFSAQGIDDDHLREWIYKAYEDAPGEGDSGGPLSQSTYEIHGKTRTNYIVLTAPRPDDADWFYAVVATIAVHPSIYVHKGLFGIGNETRRDYNTEIFAMELLVNKDFRKS
uniref:CRISPR-associated endonuclease Cas9 (EC) n=1 Tax=Ganoderma boninense TaxID=34458 RepID=A0A5K1JX64_9APHY|nr:CRISPR-associated endonuclease Cas9 (EC [Ganoderma boninense]